jgi:hypothetical protein
MAVLPKPQAQGALPEGKAGGYASAASAPPNIEYAWRDTIVNVNKFLGKIKEENDDANVEQAYNDLINKQNELTFGDDGFKNRRAEDAVSGNMHEEYSKKWNDSYVEIKKKYGLSNDQLRKLEPRALAANRQFSVNILGHYAQESRSHQKNVFENTLYTAKTEAAQNSNDLSPTGIVATNLLRAETAAIAYADREGLDADVAVLKAKTEIHAGVIQGMLDAEQPKAAEGYLELYYSKDEISADVYTQFKSKVKAHGQLAEVQEGADSLFSEFWTGDVMDNNAYNSMLKAARERYDGETEKGIISDLKTRWTEQVTGHNMQIEELAGSVAQYFVQNPEAPWHSAPGMVELIRLDPGRAGLFMKSQEKRAEAARVGVTKNTAEVEQDLNKKQSMGVMTEQDITEAEAGMHLTAKSAESYRRSIREDKQKFVGALDKYFKQVNPDAKNERGKKELADFKEWAMDYAETQGSAPAEQMYNIWKMEGYRRSKFGIGDFPTTEATRRYAKEEFMATPPVVDKDTGRKVFEPFDKAIVISREAGYPMPGSNQIERRDKAYAQHGALAIMELNRMHGYEVSGLTNREGSQVPKIIINSEDPYQIAAVIRLIQTGKPVTPKNIAIYTEGVKFNQNRNRPPGGVSILGRPPEPTQEPDQTVASL